MYGTRGTKSKSGYPTSAALLQSRGVEITALIEQTVAREAHAAYQRPAPEAVANAVDRILERRSRLTLNGLKIRDLIDEGRSYSAGRDPK